MFRELENRMVVDAAWAALERQPEIEEKLQGAGHEEIGTGIFVPKEDAYDYALERVSQDEDLKQEFVEWFYSGNWIMKY